MSEQAPEPERWPDGTIKSMDNGFRLGVLGVDHGFTPGLEAAAGKRPRRYASSTRHPYAFGSAEGTIPGMGNNKQ